MIFFACVSLSSAASLLAGTKTTTEPPEPTPSPAPESFTAAGVVIRDEYVLPDTAEFYVPLAQDGERVSAYCAVALLADGRSELDSALRTRAVTMELDVIEDLLSVTESRKSERTRQTLLSLSASHDALARRLACLALGYLTGGTERDELYSRREELREELTVLNTAARYVPAPEAGEYFSGTDGYEYLTPDLSVSELRSIIEAAPEPKVSAGRLVTSPRWYWAAVIPGAELDVGETVTLVIAGNAVEARVVRTGEVVVVTGVDWCGELWERRVVTGTVKGG